VLHRRGLSPTLNRNIAASSKPLLDREAPVPHAVVALPAVQVLAPGELARLAVYRAAVRAGFVTDWPGRRPRT
jgi:hypothetical protein